MNLIRTIARVIAAALWFLSGGTLGALIAYLSTLWYHGYLFRDEPINAADAMFVAALLGVSAPLGLIAGLLCALYLWARWALYQGKPKP